VLRQRLTTASGRDEPLSSNGKRNWFQPAVSCAALNALRDNCYRRNYEFSSMHNDTRMGESAIYTALRARSSHADWEPESVTHAMSDFILRRAY
jgi:hypothetical protein